jgi:hypothetical protein
LLRITVPLELSKRLEVLRDLLLLLCLGHRQEILVGLIYVDSVIHLGFGGGDVRADEYAQEELEYDEGSGDHPDGNEH